MLSIFIFVPLYIRYLGIENYAIIGFYTLLLGIISFADSGMSSAIIKEFATDNSSSYKYSVLRRIEKLYWSICLAMLTIIIFSSNLIAQKWFSSETLAKTELSYYVILIGIGIVFQLVSSLYYGALFGLNEQVKVNFIQIIWNLIRSAVVVLLLIFIKPTLEVYFLWQILCNVLYVCVLRFLIIKKLKKFNDKLEVILPGIPKDILKYIGGMSLIAIISSINTQADKIIVSSFFSLKTFGYYNIVSILAQIPIILATPIALFIFPLFSKFSNENTKKLEISFNKISFLLSVLIVPTTLLLIIYAKEIIYAWVGNNISVDVLSQIALVLRLLCVGSLFLSIQFPLFYLLLSKSQTKYNVYQGVVQISLGLPLLYFCVSKYGLNAVALPWILINFGSFIYLSFICFKKYLEISFIRYLIDNMIIPLIISITAIFMLNVLYVNFINNFYLILVLSGLISVLLIIIINNIIRRHNIFDFKSLYNFP
ncbi:oligosaccharide flippase family protein [Flavobacterium covae]|nr:oligosaccharide flippase family protein [Flavobacterium covae]